MELNSLLGNFRYVETNWFPLAPDSDVSVELRSPKFWIDEYAKLVEKYEGSSQTREIKTVFGSNRKVTVNKKTETPKIKEQDSEKDKKFSEETKKFLIDNVIVNWKNIELNGETIEFSKENAEKVFDLTCDGMDRMITSMMMIAMYADNFTEANHYNPDEESVKK